MPEESLLLFETCLRHLKTFNAMRSRKWRSHSLSTGNQWKDGSHGTPESLSRLHESGVEVCLEPFSSFSPPPPHTHHRHALTFCLWSYFKMLWALQFHKGDRSVLSKCLLPNLKLFIQLEYWSYIASLSFLGWEMIFLLLFVIREHGFTASEFSHII